MKSPHEEWVDGSWTVDCVCGVRFDDGKEMVNCDECGVWVHTWCSRYVKGDDDLFACHKCKIKPNKLSLLNHQGCTFPMGQSFRACAEIPIEERVHVHGVPGGDSALLEGFSSVFSRQLWKCTGYVPKKFRLEWREFPCWDDRRGNLGGQEDSCDGVLFEENDAHVVGTNDGVTKEKSLLCSSSTDNRRREGQS